jgi:hypothetical protein
MRLADESDRPVEQFVRDQLQRGAADHDPARR